MKSPIIKFCLLAVFAGMLCTSADAQRTSRRRTGSGSTGNNTSTNASSGDAQEQNNNAKPPSGYNPYGNIPIEEIKSEGGNDSVTKKSLRPADAFDKSFVNDRTPLPYEHLRWDDAFFMQTVWRELDLREKMNQPFRYEAQDDNGSQMFIDILLKAVRQDSIVAFQDDRFTTPLSSQEMALTTAGGAKDTVPVYDPNDPDKILKYQVTQEAFDSKSVTKLRIKEQWIFDREASRLFVRILGIAPVKTLYLANGQERGSTVLFWVYYPDLRPTLAKYEVYNPKNMGYGRMTWEELWESRMFASYITKSTFDNPSNKNIRQKEKDTILALLEGDNQKERIFNFEQDLWQY